MNKYKYFRVDSKVDFSHICAILQELPLNDTSYSDSFGFKVIKKTSSSISCLFYEKKYLETDYIDINGDVQTITHINLDEFEFTISLISEDKFHLILKNPTRAISFFKLKIGELFNYKISINSLTINPILWLENIESSIKNKFQIISVEIKNINYSKNILANLTFKGSDDIRTSYFNYIHSEQFEVSKILATNNDYFSGKIILSNDASIHSDVTNEDKLVESLINKLISN